ncbi:unnamed protein product, partial [Owenia fusiformis]
MHGGTTAQITTERTTEGTIETTTETSTAATVAETTEATTEATTKATTDGTTEGPTQAQILSTSKTEKYGPFTVSPLHYPDLYVNVHINNGQSSGSLVLQNTTQSVIYFYSPPIGLNETECRQITLE